MGLLDDQKIAELDLKLRLVTEARQIGGVAAAADLWNMLGLPAVFEDSVDPFFDQTQCDEVLAKFADDCTLKSTGDRVQSSVMYAAYVQWCVTAGESALSHKSFSSGLKRCGFKTKRADVVWFLDTKLVDQQP